MKLRIRISIMKGISGKSAIKLKHICTIWSMRRLFKTNLLSNISVIYIQLIFKFTLIYICISTNFLCPVSLIIKVNVFRILLSFLQLISCFYFSKPCLVFLMEHPILLFQFNGCQILLVCSLLVIEGEKECVQIKRGKILFPVE